MATYAYRSNMPSVSDTVAGVVFTAGVNIEYEEDQLELNRFVPARLDRWVDGTLTNTDLVTPDVISAQERYNSLAEVNLTTEEVAAVKVAVGNGSIGSGVGVTVIDNLLSSSTTAALSANQGLILKGLVDTTSETAVDAVAAALAAGTHSNVTVIYNDVANSISLTAVGGAGATNISTTPGASTVVVVSDSGTDGTLVAATSTTAGLMLPAQVDKLAGIAASATANSSDASLLSRNNHTDTQPASTISDFTEAAQDAMAAAIAAGSHSNVTVNYNDSTNSISFTAAGGAGATNISTTPGASTVIVVSDSGTDGTLVAATSTTAGLMLPAQVDKLAGIASSATANSSDATLLARANHTGTQASTTISDFTEAAQDAVAAALAAGTHSGVSFVYDDVGNSISLTSAGGTGSGALVVENITTGVGYTLVTGDANKVKRCIDTAAQTVNITTAFNGLDVVLEWPAGSGRVTLAAGTGVNLNGLGDGVDIELADAAGSVSIIHTGTNTWDVQGAVGNLVISDVTDSGSVGRSVVQATSTGMAQTAVGVVIGTHVQAYDAALTALAALTIAANSLTIGTGADAFSQTTFAANTFPARASTGALEAKPVTDFALTLLDDTSQGAVQFTLGLVPGTNVQAYDATLAALAALTIAANSLSIGSGTDAFSQVTFAANTFPGRSASGNLVAKTISEDAFALLAAANYAAMRTAMGVPTIAEGKQETLIIAASDETTALTTGLAKVTFRMPYAMTVTAVRASVTTAPTGAALIVDINDGVTTIMSTNKLSIDATETTSTTAATAATVTDTALADDAEITIDIDQVGSTVAGAGLKVYITGTRA